jgi:hypothetical protein
MHMVLLGVWIPTAAAAKAWQQRQQLVVFGHRSERSPDRQAMQALGSLASLCLTGNEEEPKQRTRKEKET